MEKSDIPGSVADQAALFDEGTARGTRRAAQKAQPAKRAPRKATVAAAEVTTPAATAPVPPTRRAKAASEKPAKATASKAGKATKTATPQPAATKRTARTAAPKTSAAAKPKTAEPQSMQPETNVNAEPELATPVPVPPAEPAAHAVTEPPTPRARPLWEQLVTEPRRTVDHAALAAVRDLGPAAQRWLERTRQRYPTADEDALARLASYEYRTAGGRRTAAVAGAKVFGPFVVAGTLMRTQAEVVLAIAGAYGLDPTNPDRAADLMTVLHVRSVSPVVSLAVRVLADRAVPFGGALAALAQQRRATADVAERARSHFRHYRPGM
jgi:hypothetical protein